jgi:hypothetical protein
MLRLLFFLVPLVLCVFCLVQAISSRDDEIRHLRKTWWILLILFFPFVGSIAWLVAGRPQTAQRRQGPHERSTSAYPEYDRPGRFAAADPQADEEFLRKVRERAEEQRRKHREQQERETRGSDEAGPAPEEPTA